MALQEPESNWSRDLVAVREVQGNDAALRAVLYDIYGVDNVKQVVQFASPLDLPFRGAYDLVLSNTGGLEVSESCLLYTSDAADE